MDSHKFLLKLHWKSINCKIFRGYFFNISMLRQKKTDIPLYITFFTLFDTKGIHKYFIKNIPTAININFDPLVLFL